MAIPNLLEFINKRRTTQAPDDVYQLDQQKPRTVQTQQQPAELPKIDTSDVIGSLNGMLGPTPEERAAEEQRLQQHRQKMHGWAAVFNGIRQLSNLYFTTKGAAPQKYGDPHAEIEQQYQDERKRLADIQAQNQKYYAGLWGMYRQINDEQRRNMLAEAQRDYYGSREEAARQKSELDRLKAVRVIKQTDGSLVKFDPVTGETEQLSEADPLYIEYKRSQINKNNRTGTGGGRGGGRNNGTYGYRTTRHVDPATGDVITERVPTTGNQPAGREKTTTTVTHPKKKGASGGGNGQQKKKHVGW